MNKPQPFIAVELETFDGHLRVSRWTPNFTMGMPEVIFWGIRHFLLVPGPVDKASPVYRYKEVFAFCVQENVFPNIPGKFPVTGNEQGEMVPIVPHPDVDLVELRSTQSLVTGKHYVGEGEQIPTKELEQCVEMGELLLRTLAMSMQIDRVATCVSVWREQLRHRVEEKDGMQDVES